MKNGLRDKSRNELAYALNSLGIEIEMAKRGRVEEEMRSARGSGFLGTINIPDGPIRWINVVRVRGGG